MPGVHKALDSNPWKTVDESQALTLMCVTGAALDSWAQPKVTVLGGRALIKN